MITDKYLRDVVREADWCGQFDGDFEFKGVKLYYKGFEVGLGNRDT